jgi:hypothetical protein
VIVAAGDKGGKTAVTASTRPPPPRSSASTPEIQQREALEEDGSAVRSRTSGCRTTP